MPYDNFKSLRIAVAGGVARLTIDHGEINLFDLTLIVEMDRAGRELEADENVRAVVIQSANPDFFIAHADLNLIQGLPAAPPPRAEKLGLFHAMCSRFRTMPKATIAKIEGICRGGGSEFVQACDMRFAALGRAVLSQPEVAIGIIPGGGGCVRLPRLVGRSRALEVILGCDDIPADVAERYGYVNRAFAPDKIGPFVDALAGRIATFSPDAVRLAKEMVLRAETAVEDDLVQEERSFFESAATPAAKKAMAAAMSAGFQTAAVERQPISTMWERMAR
jgi:enoyl-CoA hydratase/carnithine racemase